jgi:hypothetical protein
MQQSKAMDYTDRLVNKDLWKCWFFYLQQIREILFLYMPKLMDVSKFLFHDQRTTTSVACSCFFIISFTEEFLNKIWFTFILASH